MPLHPKMREILALKKRFAKQSLASLPIDFLRAGIHALYGPAVRGPHIEVERIADLSLKATWGTLPCRVYFASTRKNLPLLVFFHGGGWVVGDLDLYDTLCRRLCLSTGWPIVSVGYRLAPENPFPAALEDAQAAIRLIHEHADHLGGNPDRLVVAGDSAGGNLAAVVAQQARDKQLPSLAAQVLIYPVLDLTNEYVLSNRATEDVIVTAENLAFYTQVYAGEANRADPNLSPLRAADLSDLPPTLFIQAEYDVLRSEGEAYAAALVKEGNSVRAETYQGMLHGFVMMTGMVSEAHEAIETIGKWLNEVV